MSLRLEDIVKASSLGSLSRAGRMSESLCVQAGISTKSSQGKRKRSDGSALLSIAEIGDTGASIRPFVQGVDDEDRHEELCSSAREHPTLQKKAQYVVTLEKEMQFRNALSAFAPVSAQDLVQKKPSTPSPVVASPDRANSPQGKAKPPTSPQKKTPKLMGSSAFLPHGSRFSDGPRATSPPVGHYHPRHTIVDRDVHTPHLVKPKLRAPEGNSIVSASSSKACGSPSVDVSKQQDAKPEMTKEEKKKAAEAAKPRPSPCFLSRARDNRTRSPSPPPENDPVFPSPTPSSPNLSRQIGRDSRQEKPNAPDVFYDVRTPTPHVHTTKIVLPPERARSVRSPAGDRERPELSPNFNLRFQSVTSPVKMDRTVGRKDPPPTSPTQSELHIPQYPQKHLPGVNIAKLQGWKKDPPPEDRTSYEPDLDYLRGRTPCAVISPIRDRASPAAEEKRPTAASYNVNIDVVRPRVGRAVAFGPQISREKREGPRPLGTESSLDFVTIDDSPARTRIKGDPMIRTNVSRDQREKIKAGNAQTADLFYDVPFENAKSSLKLGYVEFAKAVPRDKPGRSSHRAKKEDDKK